MFLSYYKQKHRNGVNDAKLVDAYDKRHSFGSVTIRSTKNAWLTLIDSLHLINCFLKDIRVFIKALKSCPSTLPMSAYPLKCLISSSMPRGFYIAPLIHFWLQRMNGCLLYHYTLQMALSTETPIKSYSKFWVNLLSTHTFSLYHLLPVTAGGGHAAKITRLLSLGCSVIKSGIWSQVSRIYHIFLFLYWFHLLYIDEIKQIHQEQKGVPVWYPW